jgi:hypothetical protein
MPEVKAKVAAVLDAYQIALNVGADEGVDIGDRVDLWNNTQVTDPDSGTVLGTVRTQKLRLELIEVQDHLSVARVYSPPINFGELIFQRPPSKTINVPGKANQSNVTVTRGEEATIHVPDSDEPAEIEASETAGQ